MSLGSNMTAFATDAGINPCQHRATAKGNRPFWLHKGQLILKICFPLCSHLRNHRTASKFLGVPYEFLGIPHKFLGIPYEF